jgi:hypothetical protein
MIRRTGSAVGLFCVYAGQPGVVLDQRDHCGPDAAGTHANTAGHWGWAGVPGVAVGGIAKRRGDPASFD